MASNTVWRITWGDYDFALDRRTLTYDLTETQTGTVWASSLSVGWIELKDRVSGEHKRHDFSAAKVVSVVEKASSQGKRLLIGLDLLGIPIDLYFICSQREIQLTVEASRDTRQFLVQDVGLLSGLLCVSNDGASYIVLPYREGAIAYAGPQERRNTNFPIWDYENGLTMPFGGAVRCTGASRSALSLVTDSAYGRFRLSSDTTDSLALNVEFDRDPERRRIEVRLGLLAHGDHISIARAYRDKIIEDRNHITLRRKARDHMALAQWTGVSGTAREPLPPGSVDSIVYDSLSSVPLRGPNRWQDMEERTGALLQATSAGALAGAADGVCDWAMPSVQVGAFPFAARNADQADLSILAVPLMSVVYRDCFIPLYTNASLLRTLLRLAPPVGGPSLPGLGSLCNLENRELLDGRAILRELYQLTFTAFLTSHRFVTADRSVEEAGYSDKTRVIVNHSESEPFERDDLHLPPQGFYVRHGQLETHYALRVGDKTFATPVWRIRRSLDGKPLEESEDVLVREFPAYPELPV